MVDGYRLFGCQDCQHLQLAHLADVDRHVAEVYDDDYFFGGGDGYPDYLAGGDVLERQAMLYRELLARHGLDSASRSSAPSLLDVGCAAGFVLRPFADSGFKTLGVEPNARLATFAREHQGLDVERATIEEFLETHQERYDAILLIQIIAHLDRPEEILERLVERLQAGGLLLVETWDHRSLTARIFGRRWHEYSPPSVRHWFSRRSLDRLSERLGLIREGDGAAKKRLQWQHARGLISHKLGDGLPRRCFDRLAGLLPARTILPYPGNDAFWALYRKPK